MSVRDIIPKAKEKNEIFYRKIFNSSEKYFKIVSWMVYLAGLKFIYIKTNYYAINVIYFIGLILLILTIYTFIDRIIVNFFEFLLPENIYAMFFLAFILVSCEVYILYEYVYLDVLPIVEELSKRYS